jgi:hypothetical protein
LSRGLCDTADLAQEYSFIVHHAANFVKFLINMFLFVTPSGLERSPLQAVFLLKVIGFLGQAGLGFFKFSRQGPGITRNQEPICFQGLQRYRLYILKRLLLFLFRKAKSAGR